MTAKLKPPNCVLLLGTAIALVSCGQDNFEFKESKNGDITRTNMSTGEVSIVRNGAVVSSTAQADAGKQEVKIFKRKVPNLGDAEFVVVMRHPDSHGFVKGRATLMPRTAELIVAESKAKVAVAERAVGFTLQLSDDNGITLHEIFLALSREGVGNGARRLVDDKGEPIGWSWDFEEMVDFVAFGSIKGFRPTWYGFN